MSKIEILGIPANVFPAGENKLDALETLFSHYSEKPPVGNIEDLAKIAGERGFEVNQLPPNNLDSVKDMVNFGTPVLVKYREGEEIKHGVVVGYDIDQVKVILGGMPRWLARADFEGIWEGTALTILPGSPEFKEARKFKEVAAKR